jgi:hypothetical protein
MPTDTPTPREEARIERAIDRRDGTWGYDDPDHQSRVQDAYERALGWTHD